MLVRRPLFQLKLKTNHRNKVDGMSLRRTDVHTRTSLVYSFVSGGLIFIENSHNDLEYTE